MDKKDGASSPLAIPRSYDSRILTDGVPGRLRILLSPGGITMLRYAVAFLVIAIIAGILGLSGVAGTATNIAYALFVIFVLLALVGFLTGRKPAA